MVVTEKTRPRNNHVSQVLLEGNTGRSVVVQLSLVDVFAVVPDETVRSVRLGVLVGIRVSTRLLVVLQLLLQLGDQTSLLVVRLLSGGVVVAVGQGGGRDTGSGGTGGNSSDGDGTDTRVSTSVGTGGESGRVTLEVLLAGHAVTDDTLERRRLGSTTDQRGATGTSGQSTRGETTGSETGTGRVRVVLVGSTGSDDGNVGSGPGTVVVVSSNDGDVGSVSVVVTVVVTVVGVVTVSVGLGVVYLAEGRSSGLLAVEIVVTGPDNVGSLPLDVGDGTSGQTAQRVITGSVVLSVGSDSLGVGLESGRTSVSTSDTSLARGGVPGVSAVTGRGSVVVVVRARGVAGSETRGGTVRSGGGRGRRAESVSGGGGDSSDGSSEVQSLDTSSSVFVVRHVCL